MKNKFQKYDNSKILIERGGFDSFVAGIGKSIKGLADKTVFGNLKKMGASELSANSLITAAENLKVSVQYAASEIDNVIYFLESIGRKNFEGIESTQKKLREIYLYTINIAKEVEGGSKSFSSLKEKMDEYSEEMKRILGDDKRRGTIEKWKDSVLGESREDVVGQDYLESGKNLVKEARSILQKVNDRKYIEIKADQNNADKLFKKAINAVRGVDSDKEKLKSKIKTKSDYGTFSRTPKESEISQVSKHQERLKSLGYLKDFKSGSYDEKTTKAEESAMRFLSKITGKIYNVKNEDSFKDFQQDLAYYADHKDEIRKKLENS